MLSRPGAFVLVLLLCGCSGGTELGGDSWTEDAGAPDDAETRDDGSEDRSDARDATVDDGRTDVPDDGRGLCAPMDVHPAGPCDREPDLFLWDGTNCVPLGSGCECAGPDCDAVYGSLDRCVTEQFSCYDPACEAQPVWDSRCELCDPDDSRLLGVFWNGRECFELIGCSECVGDGCARGYASIEECEWVHRTARCDAIVCESPVGEYYRAGSDPCLFTCGLPNPPPGICDPSWGPCDCGPGRTFIPGTGCRDDETCDGSTLCWLSGGDWRPGDVGLSETFRCGRVTACPATVCGPPCDCGVYRNFDAALGCVPDLACSGTMPETICTTTGGRWPECSSGGPCPCRYDCGVAQSVCVEPTCDCGPFRSYDEARGCVYDPACVERDEGDPCTGNAEHSNCRAGLVCCTGCGMPLPCPSCRAPCCPGLPTCGGDGCPIEAP